MLLRFRIILFVLLISISLVLAQEENREIVSDGLYLSKLENIHIDDSTDFGHVSTLFDIDGDNEKEIITAVTESTEQGDIGKILILEFDGGTSFIGEEFNEIFINPISFYQDDNGPIFSLVSFSGNVYLFDNRGNVKDGWPKSIENEIWPFTIIEDLDNDNKAEIIVASRENREGTFYIKIYVFDINGNLISPAYPISFEGEKVRLTIGNLDEDDSKEIITLTENNIGNIFLRAFNLEDASMIDEHWPLEVGRHDMINLISGDLDNDGIDEILISLENEGLSSYNKNGEKMWTYGDIRPNGLRQWVHDMALGNLNEDENLEIVASLRPITTISGDEKLVILDKNGNEIRPWPLPAGTFYPIKHPFFVNIGDINGDKQGDIINTVSYRGLAEGGSLPRDFGIIAYDFNGNLIKEWLIFSEEYQLFGGPVTITDVTNDGITEIVVLSRFCELAPRGDLPPIVCGEDIEGYRLDVLSLNGEYDPSTMEWSIFRHDSSYTGHYTKPVTRFIRGDANGDGNVDLSDPIYTLSYLFSGGKAPKCFDAADSNDDGVIDLSDPIYTLSHLFRGDPAPPAPYPDQGIDQTPDAFNC